MRSLLAVLLVAAATSAFPQVAAIEALLKQRPEDPTLWFFLSQAQSQLGNKPASIAALENVDKFGDGFLPAKNLGFANVWDDPKFQEIVKRLQSRLPRLDYAPTVIQLEDRTLLPEGIAYDAPSNNFFIGSTTKGVILRVGFGNALSEFAPKQEGLDGVLGLAVDAPRRTLYAVATSALTEEGRKRRRNAVLAFDLDSHRLMRIVEVAAAMQLNDVTVAFGGRVFASDSTSGAIFEILKEGPPRTLVPADQVRGSNGLAASPDAKRLYVAHSTGIAVVDLDTGAVKRVANTTRENIAAIDGLYEFQGELIGVQNVTNPGRVIAISLAKDGASVTRVRTLLSHHHNALDEPTTGAVTERGFFLLAATGVGHLGQDGKIEDAANVPQPAVVRVLLPR